MTFDDKIVNLVNLVSLVNLVNTVSLMILVLRMLKLASSKYRGPGIVTCIVVHLLWVAVVSSVEVEVDYTINDQHGDTMPDDVNVTVSVGTNTTASLRLSRVPHINLDFPLYTLNHDGTGTMVRRREKHASKNMTAFYQDVATDAVFQLTRNEKPKNKKDLFKLKGEFKISGESYFLKSEKRMKSGSQTKTTSAPQRSTTADSPSSPAEADGELYSLEVHKVRHPTIEDFVQAPLEVMVPKRRPTVSDVSTFLDLDSQNQDIKTAILKIIDTDFKDQMIDPWSNQSHIHLDSEGSSEGLGIFSKFLRRRRSTPIYSVDVAAVVDYLVYRHFLAAAGNDREAALQKIREYFAFVFNGVDQRYQSIQSIQNTFIIRVYLSQVFVVESSSASPLADTYHPGNTIDSLKALEAFKYFIAQRAKDIGALFDHAMLFTGYDLTGKADHQTAGIAYISTLCKTDGASVSVVEEMDDYHSISLASHELAHSLSAEHDGEGNRCYFSDRYIMAAVTGTPETQSTVFHPWQFSPCSVAYFTTYVRRLMLTSRGITCLTGHPPTDNFPDVSGRLLGQEVPPDQQCQATHGSGSKLCRGLLTNGTDICHRMYCLDALTHLCYPREALDGTTCGNGKICRSGHCVFDPQAPTVDEMCMFGDETGIVWNGMNCPQLVKDFPGRCYSSNNKRICCNSCQAAIRTVKDCEYGDRLLDCSSLWCSGGSTDIYYSKNCCGTCHSGVPFTTRAAKPNSVVTYASRPAKTTAAQTDDVCRNKAWSCYFLNDDTMTQCYNSSFNRDCCQSCQQHHTKISDCEYGDHWPELCTDKSICQTNSSSCCYSCRKSSSNIIRYSGLLTILHTSIFLLITL